MITRSGKAIGAGLLLFWSGGALAQGDWRNDATLLQAARTGDSRQRQGAAAALARRASQTSDRRIVALFVDLSRSKDAGTRRVAVDGLWAATGWIRGNGDLFHPMDFRSPEALAAMLAMTEDPDPEIRDEVYGHLRRLLGSYHPGLDMAHLVKHPQPQVRASALAYTRREGVTRHHVWALADREPLVRQVGMRSLRGALEPEHILILKGMVETGDAGLRERVAEVLASSDRPEAAALLRMLTKDRTRRNGAMRACAQEPAGFTATGSPR